MISYPIQVLFEAEYRYASYFLSRLKAINDVYTEYNERAELALAELSSEWAQINNAYQWALINKHDSRAAQMCAQFPIMGHMILTHRQPLSEHLEWLKNGLTAARRLHDTSLIIELLNSLGMVYLHQQNNQEALSVSHEALDLLNQDDGDKQLFGSVLNTL
ncbi:MAG: hypothetical protein CUN55_17125, partial [Phototrophicales bacterium]